MSPADQIGQLEVGANRERANAERAACADLLVRIVAAVLDEARPPLASTAWTARAALDELRAMVLPTTSHAASPLPAAVIESLSRDAGLPEVGDIDFRRDRGQEPTWPEECAWRRIEHFAVLVMAAVVAASSEPSSSNSTPGAGPVDAT